MILLTAKTSQQAFFRLFEVTLDRRLPIASRECFVHAERLRICATIGMTCI